MKTITHHSKRLPNNYGGFYTTPERVILNIIEIIKNMKLAAAGMLLDLINKQNKERKHAKNRKKMERHEFVRPFTLQETIKYGSILYVVAILVTLPVGIGSSSHQPLAFEYHLSENDLITELLKVPYDWNDEQVTLALIPGLGMELLPPPEAPKPPPFHSYIMQASEAYEVDSALIRAIIMAESSNNPRAVSHRGAQGLMQLMPTTARSLGVEDAFDPALNIDGGVRYLKQLIDRFDGNIELALAAYNAGSRYVRRYGGVPPFRATRIYIKKVLRYQQKYQVEMAPSITALRMS